MQHKPYIPAILTALLVSGSLYFFGTFNHDLWRPAEPREAGIACKMLENGNWTATYLNDDLFLEKPPLYTWTIAACLKIFGRQDWAVRIPVFLFTIATLALVFYLARIQLSASGAQGAVISLATMALFLEVNHGAMIDNGLMFFVCLAMTAFYRMQAADTERPRAWAALFYTALALAFLTKGGVGPALVLAAVGGFTIAGRRWKFIRCRTYPLLGAAILLLLIGGWLAALWHRGGIEYFNVFFVLNNLDRLTGQYGPTGNWYHYIPYIFSSAMPWTLLLPAAIWHIRREWRQPATATHTKDYWRLMAWWFGAFFVILSLAGGKAHQYLLPLLPPLAIASGAWIENTLNNRNIPRWAIALTWIFTLGVAGIASAMPWAPCMLGARHTGCVVITALWRFLPVAAGIMAVHSLTRRNWRHYWRWLAVLTVISGFTLGLFVEPALNRVKSIRPLSNALRDNLPPDAQLWGYDLGENTVGALIFYGHRHQRLEGLGDHLKLLEADQPQRILLISRRPGQQPDVVRLTDTGHWRIQHHFTAGGRWFWLMAPCVE